MTILNNFTSAYRAEAIAAMGICQKLAQVPMYAALGCSQGVMPLVSYNYSSGNTKRMKDGVRPDAHGQPDTDGRHHGALQRIPRLFSCGFSCATRPSSNMAATSSWA